MIYFVLTIFYDQVLPIIDNHLQNYEKFYNKTLFSSFFLLKCEVLHEFFYGYS